MYELPSVPELLPIAESRFPNTNPVRPADAIDAVPLLQAKQTQLFSNNPCSTHKSQTNSCRPDTE